MACLLVAHGHPSSANLALGIKVEEELHCTGLTYSNGRSLLGTGTPPSNEVTGDGDDD